MIGRFETEQKLFEKVDNIAKDLPEYAVEWYYSLKASQKTAATCKDYLTKLRHFLCVIKEKPNDVLVDDMTRSVVTKYFISIQTKRDEDGSIHPTSDSYQQSVWCCLNNFFGFLVKGGKIKESPMSLIQKPKNRDLDRINSSRKAVNKSDCVALVNVVSKGTGTRKAKSFQKKTRTRDNAIIALLISTGMRKTALTEIDVEDVDFRQRVLTVVDKGAKTHRYYLSDHMVSCIKEWMEDRHKIVGGDKGPLFVTLKGRRISGDAVYDLVKKYSGDVFVNAISPHKLRAGFCSILYNETGDVEFVRRAVGHSNISTTQRYIVTNSSEKKRAVGIIDSVFEQ